MGRLAAHKFTDEQLEVMTFKELESIAHGTLSYRNIHRRITKSGWGRRRAITQAAGGPGHKQSKHHPLKQFKGEFYSNGSTDRHAEVKRNWRS